MRCIILLHIRRENRRSKDWRKRLIPIGACTMMNEHRNVSDVIAIGPIRARDISATCSRGIMMQAFGERGYEPLGDLHSRRMPPTYDETGSFSRLEWMKSFPLTTRVSFVLLFFFYILQYNYIMHIYVQAEWLSNNDFIIWKFISV